MRRISTQTALISCAYRSWIAAARGRAAKICCVCSRRKHCRTTAFFPAIGLPGNEYGIGILSRYPFEAVELHRLETGLEEGRVLGGVTIRADGIPVRIYNTHLSFERTELRTNQIAVISKTLRGKAPCLLMGDFNILDFSELDGFQGMTPVNTAQRPIVTFPSDDGSEYPYLDNILFSASVECCWAKPYVQTVSDHIMLMAEVTVENPEV